MKPEFRVIKSKKKHHFNLTIHTKSGVFSEDFEKSELRELMEKIDNVII